MVKVFFERVFFYWRLGMYGHVRELCDQFSRESGGDPVYTIWSALANGAEGKTSAGIAQLSRITNRVAMGLPVAVAKLAIHKMAKMQDYASIGQLESEIEDLQRSANAMSVVQAAQVLWLTGDHTTALSLVQPLTTQAPANKNAAALIGWIKLSIADRNSGRWFDMASGDTTNGKGADPLVLYGKAMYFANVSRWQDALQSLVQLGGMFEFPELAVERTKIYIAMNNWDLAMETITEATGHCVSDCIVHLVNAVYMLSQAGDLDSARGVINRLCDCIDKYESENPVFTLQVVKVLIGLSWKDKAVMTRLLQTFSSVMKAHNDPDILVVGGELLLSNGKLLDAKDAFQNALVASSECITAFTGLISSHLAMNQLGEAKDQLEFLEAVVGPSESSLEVATLKAHYARTLDIPVEIAPLILAMKKHVENVQQTFTPQSARPGNDEGPQKLLIDRFLDNFLAVDLNTFSGALTEAMNECNTLERTVANPQNGPLCDMIAKLLEFVPGAVPFSYYLAVLGFGEGRYPQATKAIQSVLTGHWGFNASQCHLLLAQIRLEMKQFDDAEAALNRAVSYDFGIRNSLRYRMINAHLCEAMAQYEKAIDLLKDLMKSTEYTASRPNEKINCELFLARCYQKNGKVQEALQVIATSLQTWQGTQDEDRIKLFQASIMAKSGKIHEGLQILESFEPTNPNYCNARKKAAKIYLNNLKDKAAYIKCFKQMAQLSKGKASYMMLGDAYTKINMFDEAVANYQASLEADPNDREVALHLARALMIVHRYDDALDAYSHAIEVSENDAKPQLEYCRALVKLRRYEDARDAALDALQIDIDSADWEGQATYAEFYELMSVIDTNNGDHEQASSEISEALSLYDRLTAPGRVDIPADTLITLKHKAAALYQKVSEQAVHRNDLKAAVESLEHALELNPGNTKTLLSLAHLHLRKEDNDKCRDVCQQLLRADDKCEDAALMLAEVTASETLEDLEQAFIKCPSFFRTLVRMIEKCARTGELNRVLPLFEQCDHNAAGYNFARGLFHVYSGNPQKALDYLNRARSDPDWGMQALHLIFIIYSNPNRKYVWCESKPLATAKDLEAANKVLSRFDRASMDVEQLEAILYLSQNTTESISKALEIYEAGNDDDINATIGKCKCYLRLNRQRDATRNLNGIIHGHPNHSNFSVFVEAFLMMTFISLKEGQLDEADKYVNKAIDLNYSCGKAWELKGIIYEKKKEFLGAADAFKHAWDLSGHSDLAIGFKLAVNYMRGEDPVEAIKVSRAILAQHPNYPKLKETVFLPCCANLRP